VQEIYVTKVPLTIEGDTRFPEFETAFDQGELVLETPDFTTLWYRRIP
jgi:dihydrofolate reductase